MSWIYETKEDFWDCWCHICFVPVDEDDFCPRCEEPLCENCVCDCTDLEEEEIL